MKALVEEMLTLARADNMGPTAVLTEVSLSDVAADCALAFEPVAFESGKSLDYQLTEDVLVLGDGISCASWPPSCWTTPSNMGGTERPSAWPCERRTVRRC